MKGYVHEKEYMKALEELIRGNSLNAPNKATRGFALMYQNELKQTGCLGDGNVLNMDKLGQAFMTGRLDLQLLSKALNDSDLTE